MQIIFFLLLFLNPDLVNSFGVVVFFGFFFYYVLNVVAQTEFKLNQLYSNRLKECL